MPKALTAGARVVCTHQGTVTLVAGQQTISVGRQPLLVLGDLDGKPIAGCTLAPSPSTAPCTATASMLIGAAAVLKVDGAPVLLENATGLTNSVPPGTWSVQSAGQTILEAS